jgi:hypothetical protein
LLLLAGLLLPTTLLTWILAGLLLLRVLVLILIGHFL